MRASGPCSAGVVESNISTIGKHVRYGQDWVNLETELRYARHMGPYFHENKRLAEVLSEKMRSQLNMRICVSPKRRRNFEKSPTVDR